MERNYRLKTEVVNFVIGAYAPFPVMIDQSLTAFNYVKF